MSNQNRHAGSDFHRRIARVKFDPTQIKLLPLPQRVLRSLKRCVTMANYVLCFIDFESTGNFFGDPNRLVRKRQLIGLVYELFDLSRRWTEEEDFHGRFDRGSRGTLRRKGNPFQVGHHSLSRNFSKPPAADRPPSRSSSGEYSVIET